MRRWIGAMNTPAKARPSSLVSDSIYLLTQPAPKS